MGDYSNMSLGGRYFSSTAAHGKADCAWNLSDHGACHTGGGAIDTDDAYD